MRKIYLLFTLLFSLASFSQDLLITGVFDGPLTGGTPKVIEIYAINNVPDLSLYGIGSANNGDGSDGEEFTFSGTASTGQFLYITANETEFTTYFGITADFVDSSANINGDDAIELFFNGSVIDTFGDINVDGSDQTWEYADGWAYRLNSTGPDGSTFIESNWSFSEPDAVDGCADNSSCASVFPIGTFTYSGSPCGVTFGDVIYDCATNTAGDNNDSVFINIPYLGSNNTIINVTTSNGSLGGDDPALTADGIITISGLSEGDNWSVTLNGGDCDGTTLSGTIPASECDPTPNTCFDLSTGDDLFELVAVTPNSGFSNNGIWEENEGTYSANGFCGGGCEELVETWLIFGPLDMSSTSDFELIFDASENFGTTDLVVAYTADYSGCPSSTQWSVAQTITNPGLAEVDLSAASGTDVFVGVQYLDDGADGYSDWELSNVSLAAFGNCPTLGPRPTSNCAVCDITLDTENYICISNTPGDNNDGVTIEVPYTGVEGSITSITTTTAATVGGDDPATITDGTITLSGLNEGDSWDLTINGGDCDGTTLSGTVPSSACNPTTNDLVINEILADPAPDLAGDANGDGTRDGSEDEFVELYNIGSSDLDLSGFTIDDAIQLRHTFPAGTILPANSFITVFGGGTPTGISGLVQVSSENGLGFNNGSDSVIIKNAAGNVVASYDYTGPSDQSLGRNPDFTGDFADHSMIAGNNGALFSPNLENDDPTLSRIDFTIESIKIYPNPVKEGVVNISIESTQEFNIEIFNMLGKKVISQSAESSAKLNTNILQSGIYLIKLTMNTQSFTKKLIIQ